MPNNYFIRWTKVTLSKHLALFYAVLCRKRSDCCKSAIIILFYVVVLSSRVLESANSRMGLICGINVPHCHSNHG